LSAPLDEGAPNSGKRVRLRDWAALHVMAALTLFSWFPEVKGCGEPRRSGMVMKSKKKTKKLKKPTKIEPTKPLMRNPWET
jgi:hypothetical protein